MDSLRNLGQRGECKVGLGDRATRYRDITQTERQNCLLLVGNFLSSSIGTQSVCEDLANHLALAGWPVLTTSSKPRRLARLLDMLSNVWQKRRRYSVALVDVYSGPAFVWAEVVGWMLRRIGKPYILTLHGGNLPAFARRWPKRVRYLIDSAAAVTTPSRYLYESMANAHTDLRLLPNPLDLNAYRFRHRERLAPRLVWLRAFHSVYNPALVPRVLSCLVEDFTPIHLTMIGPDKRDGSLQMMRHVARQLGVIDRITLTGGIAKADVSDWMSKADIFLNTANVDNTPVSILEAMACGLCIVSTNVGGIPYLLEHGQDALLVSPNDPAAMAAAVRRLFNEPGLAKRLSHNARRKAEQFDWSVILPQWEDILRAVTMRKNGVASDRASVL